MDTRVCIKTGFDLLLNGKYMRGDLYVSDKGLLLARGQLTEFGSEDDPSKMDMIFKGDVYESKDYEDQTLVNYEFPHGGKIAVTEDFRRICEAGICDNLSQQHHTYQMEFPKEYSDWFKTIKCVECEGSINAEEAEYLEGVCSDCAVGHVRVNLKIGRAHV